MSEHQKAHDQVIQRASELKKVMEAELLRKPNVVGVGVGLRYKDGEYTEEVALIVMVSKKVASSELEPEDRIPEEIDNVPVDVLEVGELFAGGVKPVN
jgi:hypothetical protein